MTKRYAGWDAAHVAAYEAKRGWDKPGTLRQPKEMPEAFEAGRKMAQEGVRKMRNVPTEVDGYRFDSKKEAEHYQVLKLREKAGEITGLEIQKRYRIEINGQHICDYIADFVWKEYRHIAGRAHIQDVKGRRAGVQYQLFRIKAKLMKAVYGIEVEEI